MKKATSSQHESQEFLRKRRKEKEVFVGEECSFKAILNSFLLPGAHFARSDIGKLCKNASAGFCRSLVMNLL